MSQLPPKSLQPTAYPLTIFRLFTALPLELRQYIWALSLPGPQIHCIGQVARNRPRSSCFSPNIVLVCREARNEALHHLKRLNLPSLLSGDNCSSSTFFQPASQCCYFNPTVDTVFLPGIARIEFPLWGLAWLNGSDGTDFSLVRHLAFDIGWLQLHPRPEISLGEVVRLMGHVEVLHMISIDGMWSNRFCCLRDYECFDWKKKSEFTWVDIDEVKRRPVFNPPCIWADWGDMTATAKGGPDVLSLEGNEAVARCNDVIRELQSERIRWPDGWTLPEVQLDFVRYDRVEKKMPVWARSGGLPEPARAESSWSKQKFTTKLRKMIDHGKALRNRGYSTVVNGIRNAGLNFEGIVNLQVWVDLLFKSTWLARAKQGRFMNRAIREMVGTEDRSQGLASSP